MRQETTILLLAYRTAVHKSTGFSPAQLLMGRRLCSTLPSLSSLLQPKVDPDQVQRRDTESKSKQASYFDGRHEVRDLKELQPGDQVLVWDMQSKDWRIPAILHKKVTQRSYQVKLRNGVILRRNHHQLKFRPYDIVEEEEDTVAQRGSGNDDNNGDRQFASMEGKAMEKQGLPPGAQPGAGDRSKDQGGPKISVCWRYNKCPK